MSRYDDAVKKWQEWGIRTTADLNLRLDSFRILFAYNSGKIENDEINYHDTREIFENGKVVGYTGSTRTLFEQQNQKTCYELLQDKIISREPLSIDLIRTVHRALTEGTYDERRYIVNGERPGDFKRHDYVTGRNEVGSPPEEVEDDLAELINEINTIGQKAPLKAGAYFHARFENIHPFADGNGRISRLMMNAELTAAGQTKIIVPTVFRPDYIGALRRLSRDGDPEVLVAAMARLWDFGRWLSCGDFETIKNRLEKSGAFSDDDGVILRFGN